MAAPARSPLAARGVPCWRLGVLVACSRVQVVTPWQAGMRHVLHGQQITPPALFANTPARRALVLRCRGLHLLPHARQVQAMTQLPIRRRP